MTNNRRTSENFRQLCTGEYKVNGQPYGFKTGKILSTTPAYFKGGQELTTSIYGGAFDDENFIHDHKKYSLSMVTESPNANIGQFMVGGSPLPQFDGKYVVFGEVIEGFDIIDTILTIKRYRDQPVEDITIVDCGEY